jgi:diketogulonate reductase-like aldo/keto reductase
VKRRRFGDLELSVIGVGGYEFEDDPGWPGARDDLIAVAESGIDWIDTAEAYFDGGSERTIGAALRDVDVPMRISSKVGPAPMGRDFGRRRFAEPSRRASSDSASTTSISSCSIGPMTAAYGSKRPGAPCGSWWMTAWFVSSVSPTMTGTRSSAASRLGPSTSCRKD